MPPATLEPGFIEPLRRHARRAPTRIVVAVLCMIVVASAYSAERVIALTIDNGMVPPAQRVIRVDQGSVLKLHVTSNEPGELHLHAYRLETKVTPGASAELLVKAHATGRFRLEWHPARRTPGKKGDDHHGPALAMLEVRPAR